MDWWVMMPIVFLFVVAHAYLARWIAGYFVSKRKSDVAGFSFVLGLAYAAFGPINELEGWHKLSGSLGYILGVCAVWYLFFKWAKASP